MVLKGSLHIETHFGRLARQRRLDRLQHEIIVGALLGDGTLLQTTSGWCFRVHHGLAQREYVEFKHRLLSDYVRTPPRDSGKACYFRTVTHPEFSWYREHFYEGRRKIAPIDLLRDHLTSRGLAIWIMDDGNADGKAVRINTQSFSHAENCWLAELLGTAFGIEATVNRDKAGYRLRIAVASRNRLIELVAPHFHASMKYKLSL